MAIFLLECKENEEASPSISEMMANFADGIILMEI